MTWVLAIWAVIITAACFLLVPAMRRASTWLKMAGIAVAALRHAWSWACAAGRLLGRMNAALLRRREAKRLRQPRLVEGEWMHVRGITFDDRRILAGILKIGIELKMVRDPGNPEDGNAIKFVLPGIFFGSHMLGHMDRERAAKYAPEMDAGTEFAAKVANLPETNQDHEGKDFQPVVVEVSRIAYQEGQG